MIVYIHFLNEFTSSSCICNLYLIYEATIFVTAHTDFDYMMFDILNLR